MNTQELAMKILEINHEAKEQVRQNLLGCDLEEVMGKALDKIDRLCLEQVATHAHAKAHYQSINQSLTEPRK